VDSFALSDGYSGCCVHRKRQGDVTVAKKIQAYLREALGRQARLSDFQMQAAGKDAVVIVNLKTRARTVIPVDASDEEDDFGTLC